VGEVSVTANWATAHDHDHSGRRTYGGSPVALELRTPTGLGASGSSVTCCKTAQAPSTCIAGQSEVPECGSCVVRVESCLHYYTQGCTQRAPRPAPREVERVVGASTQWGTRTAIFWGMSSAKGGLYSKVPADSSSPVSEKTTSSVRYCAHNTQKYNIEREAFVLALGGGGTTHGRSDGCEGVAEWVHG
jgi:hypothetical protein